MSTQPAQCSLATTKPEADPADEVFDIVDPAGNVIGAEKRAVCHKLGLLHRAGACCCGVVCRLQLHCQCRGWRVYLRTIYSHTLDSCLLSTVQCTCLCLTSGADCYSSGAVPTRRLGPTSGTSQLQVCHRTHRGCGCEATAHSITPAAAALCIMLRPFSTCPLACVALCCCVVVVVCLSEHLSQGGPH